MVDYYFDLPIDPGGVPRIIHVSQYDTGRMFFMRLVKNGSPFIPPDGTYAEIIGINAKRIPFELSAGLERTTVTTNGVTTTTEVHCVRELDPVVTDGAGRVPIQVVLKRDDVTIEGGEDILGTAVIVLEVHRAGATKEDVVNAPYFVDAIVAAVNDWLNEHPPAAGGMTEDVKTALLNCFENVAWINEDGQDYYDALYAALYPPVDVLSISAVFTQGSAVIYDTDSLDTLKQYLVVTATMTDSTTRTLEDTDYTLSGTLSVGTSTITVSYGGMSTTFSVVVSEAETPSDYQLVEYIEGDGTQYINTGIIPTNTTGYEIEISSTDIVSDVPKAGSRETSGNSRYTVGYASSRVNVNWNGASTALQSVSSNVSNKISTNMRNNRSIYIDDVLKTSNLPTLYSPFTRAFLLFAYWRVSTGEIMPVQCRVYGITFTVDSDVVMQLKPCYRLSDGEIGMYDVINDHFYGNDGIGVFTKGADVQ